jgi:DNA repair protein RecN (Recombination protein N)
VLTDLNIRNFAIIDRLHVRFGSGFNVLSGETGAGKSILLGAVGLLLGARARVEDIRTGEDEAAVEALFEIDEQMAADLAPLFEEGAIDFDGSEVLIRRLVSRNGKNRVFLNGALVTLGQLQAVTGKLVTIYGQHEHQSLLKSENHLKLLDDFAGSRSLLASYRRAYEDLRRARENLDRLETGERERRQRIDLLSFQSSEIAAAHLQEGEDEELESERRLLQNAEKLTAATLGGFNHLYGEDGAVCEMVDQAATSLETLLEVDSRLGEFAEALRSAQYSLEDVAAQLRSYSEVLTFDPQRLDEVENRLAVLAGLKRKYGSTVADILAYRDQIDKELTELEDIDELRAQVTARIEQCEKDVRARGEELSALRRQAALELAQKVEHELTDLAMGQARFEIRCSTLEDFSANGLEKVEFFLAPNPGEEARPMARIASGGELSRIMLALKRAAPGHETQTLIFDEVDAGIGGVTATRVGEKLRSLASEQQVLCVTHLPQVAAFADRQYLIAKSEVDGRTRTEVDLLDEQGRVREMARMLGGARTTERSLEHARELISSSVVR